MFVKTQGVVAGLRRFVLFVAIAAFGSGMAHAQSSRATGGFMASATDNGLRPALSAGEIKAFLPSRGTFTFPSPYNTTGIRLTNDSDCGGQDCVHYVGYSYWSNINNHVGSDTMLIFLGLERTRGAGGPTLFSYNKNSGQTQNLGPLFGSDSPYSWATGEGWYFSATRATALYMNDGPRMLRYDVMSKTFEQVFNVQDQLGANRIIWQMHSSNDDRVHSATVRDSSSYAMLGCIAYDESTRKSTYVAAKGDYDECQVDKSGRWLVIKENVDGRNGEDNRIIDLQTGAETLFLDEDGAAGHSDIGYGYMVAEDNFYPQPGAVRVWHFGQDMKASGQGTLVYELTQWNSGLGHIAHGNAKPGASSQQMACSSNANRENAPRVNEIVCYRLDGSLNTLVVAPNMTNLDASGGGSDDYSKRPKGNLDVTGEYFIWTSNMGTNRNDAFIVRIPNQMLGGSPGAPAPSPTPTPTPAPSPSPNPGSGIQWMSLVNMSASGNDVEKTGGCDGCPDATAVSSQQVTSGNGSVSFKASETGTLRFVGLGSSSVATGAGDIGFALRLQSGVAEVREGGAYRTETTFAAGDTFRIAVEGGAVKYSKNGSVFYTSSSQATYALRVHAVFFSANATVREVSIGGGSGNASNQNDYVTTLNGDIAATAASRRR